MFDYIGKHPELPAIFDAGMTALHGHETAAMLDANDFSGIETLADVGGNDSLISAVLRRYPKIEGILFVLGHVVARTHEHVRAEGLADRCSMVEGSFLESVPRGADAYILRHRRARRLTVQGWSRFAGHSH